LKKKESVVNAHIQPKRVEAHELQITKDNDNKDINDEINDDSDSDSDSDQDENIEQEMLLVKAQKKAGSILGLTRYAADKLPPQEEKPARYVSCDISS